MRARESASSKCDVSGMPVMRRQERKEDIRVKNKIVYEQTNSMNANKKHIKL